MKKLLLILSVILLLQNSAYTAESQTMQVFSEKNLFGLKDASGNVTVQPEYKKLIKLGKSSYIVQKKNRFGMIDSYGNYLVEPKYTHTERVLGKYAKFGNDSNYGLYNADGQMILPHEYSKIDLLFGGMFLTYKNYKYGVVDFSGRTILENKFDDIYMPKSNIMRIKYEGEWYEIERIASEELQLPEDITSVKTDKNFKVTNLITDTGAVSGYSVLTFTDYSYSKYSHQYLLHMKKLLMNSCFLKEPKLFPYL